MGGRTKKGAGAAVIRQFACRRDVPVAPRNRVGSAEAWLMQAASKESTDGAKLNFFTSARAAMASRVRAAVRQT